MRILHPWVRRRKRDTKQINLMIKDHVMHCYTMCNDPSHFTSISSISFFSYTGAQTSIRQAYYTCKLTRRTRDIAYT